MPVKTVERIKASEVRLKKILAEKGESLEAARKRAHKKSLRRAQRRRRRMAVEAARIAPKTKKVEGSGDAAAEAPAK